VMELGDPLVLMRPGHSARSLPAMWQNRIVPLPTVDVSSTELRRLIAENRWDDPRLKDNLHPQVAQYIREHRLYAGPPLSA
jgi:nicotinic acid mononucleotide adenylyltransferase